VIYRYLDCGDLHNGFARVKLFLDLIGDVMTAAMNISWHFPANAATSARPATRKGLWNSASGSAWMSSKRYPHRHFVFSIPKILRRYFLYDRKLLADLSRSAWESLKVFLQDAVHENVPVPGAVIAMQTFGDFLGFNPHCHILLTDGCFYGDKGMFRVAPPLELKKLETIFQHKVLIPLSLHNGTNPRPIG